MEGDKCGFFFSFLFSGEKRREKGIVNKYMMIAFDVTLFNFPFLSFLSFFLFVLFFSVPVVGCDWW